MDEKQEEVAWHRLSEAWMAKEARIEDKIDKQFEDLRADITTRVAEINRGQGELKLEIQSLAGRIPPIETQLGNKVSMDMHTALERRVTKVEENPNAVRNWLTLLMAGIGCLVPMALTLLGLLLGLIYFLVNFSASH